MEIQIRTKEMDEVNEYGIAAHWYYKKGFVPDPKQLDWLSRLVEVHKESLTPQEYYQTIRDDILKDEIYVFTPKGDIFDMPKGSTAIDFAYRIHSEIGHRCKGAKENGVIIPINKPLSNGAVLEIITGKESKPKQAWLSFIKTSNARKKIKSFLSKNKAIDYENKKAEELKVELEKEKRKKGRVKNELKRKTRKTKKRKDKTSDLIEVNGEKNLLYSFAKCCSPKPNNQIIGFISRGRGIIIHKKECHNLKYIREFQKRVVEVNWINNNNERAYSFFIQINKDSDPYIEIVKKIENCNGILVKWEINNNLKKKEKVKTGTFTVEFNDNKKIDLFIKEIEKIESINMIKKL